MTSKTYPIPYVLNQHPVESSVPAAPAGDVLKGQHLDLVPLCNAGLDVFQQLFERSHGSPHKESIWEFLPYGPFGDASEMMEYYQDAGKSGDPLFYYVRDSHGAAGIVSYLRIAPDSYSIEIGHIWHAYDRHRGKANTQACFLLMQHAFQLGYRRLEWKCNALNLRSRQAALRLGLAFEGVFRQCTVSKGKNRDTAWFALLDHDWPQVEENIQKWLQEPLGSSSLTQANLPVVQWSLPAHQQWGGEGD